MLVFESSSGEHLFSGDLRQLDSKLIPSAGLKFEMYEGNINQHAHGLRGPWTEPQVPWILILTSKKMDMVTLNIDGTGEKEKECSNSRDTAYRRSTCK
jgi:hypothetical protein